jgi:hypothetical protein
MFEIAGGVILGYLGILVINHFRERHYIREYERATEGPADRQDRLRSANRKAAVAILVVLGVIGLMWLNDLPQQQSADAAKAAQAKAQSDAVHMAGPAAP